MAASRYGLFRTEMVASDGLSAAPRRKPVTFSTPQTRAGYGQIVSLLKPGMEGRSSPPDIYSRFHGPASTASSSRLQSVETVRFTAPKSTRRSCWRSPRHRSRNTLYALRWRCLCTWRNSQYRRRSAGHQSAVLTSACTGSRMLQCIPNRGAIPTHWLLPGNGGAMPSADIFSNRATIISPFTP